MTRHLYYDDPYLTEFSAVITERRTVGGKMALVLDQTALYPTSGGQPYDTGEIEGVPVENVEEDEAGDILHVLAAPLDPSITAVRARLNWERRFDHMQQHTGQHVLSQAFVAAAQAATLSFRLGQEISTIDVDLAQPDPRLLNTVEDLAARIVFEDRPVRVLTVGREELSKLGVRKETQRQGDIRVIDVEHFDRSACGGTHVRRTGEIGMIVIQGCERYKGATRVEFACGGRALNSYRKDHEALRSLGKLFSAHPHELPELCEKFLAERSALARDNKRLEEEILGFEAREWVLGAGQVGNIRVVQRHDPKRKLESLKVLAQKVTAEPGMLAVLTSGEETAQLVVARSREVVGDCGAAVKQLTAKLGGKGGGRPELAQAGGIPRAARAEWVEQLLRYFIA